jgi:hypothetical protein
MQTEIAGLFEGTVIRILTTGGTIRQLRAQFVRQPALVDGCDLMLRPIGPRPR